MSLHVFPAIDLHLLVASIVATFAIGCGPSPASIAKRAPSEVGVRPQPAKPLLPKPPLGRVRAGALACPDGEPPVYHEVSAQWQRVPPLKKSPGIDWDPFVGIKGAGPIPTRAERKRARERPPGIRFCGRRVEGPTGAYLLACRNPQGEYDGPAELIAPDGSILTQGYCHQNKPIGAWITWRKRRLETLWSHGLKIHTWTDTYPSGGLER
jgi:hypothetical protein